jgi:pimeloyl-ACP methyl ester carboxylesterase
MRSGLGEARSPIGITPSVRRATASGRVAVVAGAFIAALLLVAPVGSATAAADTTVWLCKPGLANNPCAPGLDTTQVSPSGQVLGVEHVQADPSPKVDCFYVYPTVSDDPGSNSDLSIDPEERSIALYQAARYSQLCRVFAPMYRQFTLAKLFSGTPVTPQQAALAYGDVVQAWKTYLDKYNHGRGVILIGHSQGTFVLRQLIADHVDKDPRIRKLLVSAILLGGNVVVKEGKTFGGDFQHVKGCKATKDLRCAVAFSTFDGPVPPNARFGRIGNGFSTGLNPSRFDVLCTNPANLRGGPASLDPIVPTAPFAPGTTIGIATTLIGFPQPSPPASTPWYQARGAYTGRCSSAGDADVLQIAPVDGAPNLNAIPDASWGLHLADANIALGNLVTLVGEQIDRYAKRGNQ